MNRSKKELRTIALEKRNQIDKELRLEYSLCIVHNLRKMIHGSVASYKAFNSEVDLALLEDMDTIDLSFCGIDNQTMTFYKNDEHILFETHVYGMQNVISGTITEHFDFILIPLLAYDKNGYRLGYGKGYYDRFLSTAQGIRVGVAFSVQEIESLAHELHDIPLDYVVTEKGIYKF